MGINEADRDGLDALTRADDRSIHETVRMAVLPVQVVATSVLAFFVIDPMRVVVSMIQLGGRLPARDARSSPTLVGRP